MKNLGVLAAAFALILAGCGTDESTDTSTTTTEPGVTAAAESTAETPMDENTTVATQPESLETGEDMGASEEETADEPIVLAQANPPTPRSVSRFREGVHYKRLTPTQPTSSPPDKIEVTEVFWYGCNHCYNLEPYLIRWEETRKGPNVEFVRIHGMWNEILRIHARAFYTAQVLGRFDDLHTPIFEAIHVKNNPLNTPDLQARLFEEHGIDRADFDKTFNSFAVETRLQRADQLNRRYRVSSVPVIIVNGKYTTNVQQAGGHEQLLELIDELVALEANRG